MRHRVERAVERLGWEAEAEENELMRQLRGDLLRALGTLGNDPATQERARALYARYREDESAVDANVLPALIAIVAARGRRDRVRRTSSQRFQAARTPQEEQRYLYALAGFRPARRSCGRRSRRTINGEVRSQDAPFLVRALLGGVHSRGLAWEFVKAHWETMARLYPGQRLSPDVRGRDRARQPGVGAATCRTSSRRTQIVLGGKTLEQYLEQLRIAVRLQERETAALAAYLAKPPRPPRR